MSRNGKVGSESGKVGEVGSRNAECGVQVWGRGMEWKWRTGRVAQENGEMEASETGGREMEQGKQESMHENPTLKAISSPIH